MLNIKKNLQSSSIFRNLKPRLIGGQATTYPLKPNKGFTLIELLVVVGIIGVVTGIVMSSINNAKAKGRDAKRIADISVIQLALERYYDDPAKKKYPASLSVFDLDSSVPKIDPSGNNYLFVPLISNNSSGCSGITCQSYHLGATLELGNPILDDDANIDSSSLGGFDGDNSLVYDVIPKF